MSVSYRGRHREEHVSRIRLSPYIVDMLSGTAAWYGDPIDPDATEFMQVVRSCETRLDGSKILVRTTAFERDLLREYAGAWKDEAAVHGYESLGDRQAIRGLLRQLDRARDR